MPRNTSRSKPRKRKSNYKKIGLKILIILSPVLLYLGYYAYQEIKAAHYKYKIFGTKIPFGYDLHGIDVSKHQRIINWKSVKKMNVEGIKIHFAFIKATEGSRSFDVNFYQNMLRAKQAGVVRGAYHFYRPNKDPKAQADNFARMVDLKPGDLPPVLDIEEENGQSREKIRKDIKTWLVLIERKFGVRPIIYSNADFYNRNLEGHFDNYPLWIAHYKGFGSPRISRDWHFWQHSEAAHINGISSKVDMNVFNGSEEEFEELLIK
jgi:lysozyme